MSGREAGQAYVRELAATHAANGTTSGATLRNGKIYLPPGGERRLVDIKNIGPEIEKLRAARLGTAATPNTRDATRGAGYQPGAVAVAPPPQVLLGTQTLGRSDGPKTLLGQ